MEDVILLKTSNTGETPDPLISTSNNAEMSDTISYNEAQRTCHQRRCKAGQVGKDGKIQSTIHAGETPDPLSCSSNNDEMLESQVSQNTSECSITTDYWCMNCGVLNAEVALNTEKCQECGELKLIEATENQPRMDYRFGVSYKKTPLQFEENNLNEISLSFGFGIPVRKSRTKYDFSCILGKRGTTDDNLIQEQFVRLGLSVSYDGIWFVKRKYD